MIHKPGAPDLYGYLDKQDQMPGFADQLTANDTETLIRYLRNDYPGATFPAEGPPKTEVAKAGAR
jgi:ubiquinol-cytochrome c reductase cytochrome b subunit